MATRILIKEQERQAAQARPNAPAAWRVVGWFGLLLLAIGLGDALVNWYPLGWGSPEWEFATVAATFGALPLVTMGLAALLGSMLGRGSRVGIIAVSVLALLAGLAVLGLFLLFLTDVPLALRASARTAASLAIRRGIVRTSILGLGFGVGYLAAAVLSLVSLRRRVGA